ncbi:tol-pal system protein YbgF [Sandaracinus amylolyticus]|uniref:tol-pal system protein YbgF n=1 Tax=Sandaracinus amylolyticus TaxID=927083 RepID=UPI001F01D60E|nr:tol-pal system protein YbgF [Sandaracinus amylolyticus]UJR80073.1 Cell division coordinator CpoB [Sandaracinus amylolyticus]
MRHRRLLAVAALLVGCGGAPAAASSSTTAVARADEERIRALEADLASQRAEVRVLRTELEATRTIPRDTVTIGGDRTRLDTAAISPEIHVEIEPGEDGERAPESAPIAGGSRPVLRLYGPPRAAIPGPAAPPIVPAPPEVAALGRLPVMTTPEVPAIPDQPVIVAPRVDPQPREDDPIVRAYRAALALVEARRWDDALASLRAFADAHPSHPYADNALFWQGEIAFARREYRRAIELWSALLVRYPDGNKVPDALLRIGVSYERLGDLERAREHFRRVREQYPDSVAARLASREET